MIRVLKRDPAGWWEGELNGRKGLFPNNYIEEMKGGPLPMAAVNRSPPPNSLTQNPLTANPAIAAAAAASSASSASRGPPPVKMIPIGSGMPPPKATSPSSLPQNAPSTFDAKAGNAERKPAGQVRGGGDASTEKKVTRVSKTKFGLWSSNMAWYGAMAMIPMGLYSILWYMVDSRNHSVQYLLSGLYSFFVGWGVMWYEKLSVATRIRTAVEFSSPPGSDALEHVRWTCI